MSHSYLIKVTEGSSLCVLCAGMCIAAIASSGDLCVPVRPLISTPALRVLCCKSVQTMLICSPPEGKDFLDLTLQFQSE